MSQQLNGINFLKAAKKISTKGEHKDSSLGTISAFLEKNYLHYNAGVLLDAAKEYKKLIDSGGKMMVSLAGAMSTAQLGISLAEMIRQKKISAISCTGANLEEDVFNLVVRSHYEDVDYTDMTKEDEKDLLKKHLNRVTDVCIPEKEAMRVIEKLMEKLWLKAQNEGKSYFPHEYLYQLLLSGDLKDKYEVDPKESWMLAAAENNLPIIVAGWEDSSLGNIFASECIDGVLKPSTMKGGIEYMMHLCKIYPELAKGKGIGFFQIGGGIAGDFTICVVPLLKLDLKKPETPFWKYYCQISDAVMSYGGYCISGDTKVSLLNGSEVEIRNLIKDEYYWIYGCKDNGEIVPVKAKALGITRRCNEYVNVTLDNDISVDCTKDHLWMLRDGSYKRAESLKEGDSLMPLYRMVNEKGYEEHKDNLIGEWHLTHRMVNLNCNGHQIDESNKRIIENKSKDRFLVTHHKDENKRNNEPDNLIWLGENEHWLHHAKCNNKNKLPYMRKASSERMKNKWKEEGFKERMSEEMSIRAKEMWRNEEYATMQKNRSSVMMKEMWQDENYREKFISNISEMNKKNWQNPEYIKKKSEESKKLWQNPEYRKHISDCYQKNRDRIIQSTINGNKVKKNIDARQKAKLLACLTRIESFISFEEILKLDGATLQQFCKKNNIRGTKGKSIEKYFGSFDEYLKTYSLSKEKLNHKVKSVTLIKAKSNVDFYDLYVEETNNFAISAGVFIHNSGAGGSEKITWSKVDVDTPMFCIQSDATIAAPLIFAYVLNQ